jgi:hypothetical protein
MPRPRLEDNIKVDVKYVTGTDRIGLAEDKDRWQAVSMSVHCFQQQLAITTHFHSVTILTEAILFETPLFFL